MTKPDEDDEQRTVIEAERREEAEERNPDLHGRARDALEGNDDGAGRTRG